MVVFNMVISAGEVARAASALYIGHTLLVEPPWKSQFFGQKGCLFKSTLSVLYDKCDSDVRLDKADCSGEVQ